MGDVLEVVWQAYDAAVPVVQRVVAMAIGVWRAIPLAVKVTPVVAAILTWIVLTPDLLHPFRRSRPKRRKMFDPETLNHAMRRRGSRRRLGQRNSDDSLPLLTAYPQDSADDR